MSLKVSLLVLALVAYGSLGHAKLIHYEEDYVKHPQAKNPNGLFPSKMGASGGSTWSFIKVLTRGSVTKWVQTCDGVEIYSSIITTHANAQGLIDSYSGQIAKTQGKCRSEFKYSLKDAEAVVAKYWKIDITKHTCSINDKKKSLIVDKTTGDSAKSMYYILYVCYPRKNNRHKSEKDRVEVKSVEAWVDAMTGEIIDTWPADMTAKVRGIMGNSKIGRIYDYMEADDVGKRCYHRHTRKRIQVFDMQSQTNYYSSLVRSNFRCSRAKETAFDRYSETGGLSPKNEAFLYANHFYDLWYELMGPDTEPHQSNSSWLNFYVHYDLGLDNAFFDGTRFSFGDGRSTFYPLTSLDVVCHEIGHAITRWHGGNMVYRNQPGGMNEAYSDILGETCDIRFKGATNFLIGSSITKTRVALRDMCNPRNLAPSIDHFRDYSDGMNVHYSSGIYNKAFCLLSRSQGWNYYKAFQVFTEANLMYWTADIDMACGVCGVARAARTMRFGDRAVHDAFKVVGLTCRC